MSRSYSSSSSQHYSSGSRRSGGAGGSFRKSYGEGGGSGLGYASSSSYSSLGSGFGMGLGSGSSGGMGLGAFGRLSGASSMMSLSTSGGGIVTNEKETMINLNNRLSAYLQKVKDLESANTQLELQLREFQVGKAISGIDYAAYDAVIRPLRDQILSIHLGNARLALDLDNASLAARDFKNKFENEFNTRQSVEADISDLKYLKEEYIRNYKDLESEIAAAQDELVYLKKNHEEELVILRQQVTGTVSVDVASGPAPDLTKALAQIREEYENICSKNQAETEAWYKQQVETKTVQTVQVNEAAEAAKLQVTELRRQFQTLQAEYDSLFSGNCSLEASIQDINDSYSQKLHGLQVSISQLEMDMINIRNEVTQKVKDYELLLNIKMQLEKEIATYRQLIEGTNTSQFFTTSGTKETSGLTTTTTIETRTSTQSSHRM